MMSARTPAQGSEAEESRFEFCDCDGGPLVKTLSQVVNGKTVYGCPFCGQVLASE